MNPSEQERVNAPTITPESTTGKERYPNRDPITDEPGAHMVGTGIGAAAGGIAGIAATAATGAATGTMIGGPIGTAVGLVAGAVVGGMLGSAASEALLPTEIDQHWSSSYTKEPYYNSDYTYDDYLQAYRTGAEGFDADPDKTFAELEAQLQDDYLMNRGRSRLSWTDARPAVLAAWERRRMFHQAASHQAA
jgi:uncharacterized protein YcfJ